MTVRENAAGGGDLDIASIGALFADLARCRMMLALSDGAELSAARLAAEANVTAATASSHLKKLTDAGLLLVTPRGRIRNYRIAGPQVGELIEALEQVAPVVAAQSRHRSTEARQWREGRTCYDHLAGHLGVAVLDGFLARGLIALSEPTTSRRGQRTRFRITEAGAVAFSAFGLDVRAGQQVEAHHDSTERRPHLAARFARLLTGRLLEAGWIQKTGHRAVQLTTLGADEMAKRFGLSFDG